MLGKEDCQDCEERPPENGENDSVPRRLVRSFPILRPELSAEHRSKIVSSKRVAVPGCYATGFIAIAYPLIKMGILPADYPVTCHAVSGYSGAGKPMIAKYNDINRDASYGSPRQYALSLTHKHIPEMKCISGLEYAPIFNPMICDYYCGMVVTVPLFARLLNIRLTPAQLCERLGEYYSGQKLVKVMPVMGEGVLPDGMIAANALENQNHLELFVYGNNDQLAVAARLDNLGKGASGAAVQCMNIMLGLEETAGLI